MDIPTIEKAFAQAFDSGQPPRVFFAPGRVNLIGEHTDYNGGYVFPCALSLGVYGAARRRDDGVIRLKAADFEPEVTLAAGDLPFDPAHGWANYVKGVVRELRRAGHAVGGFELYVQGDLPNRAGLSSSAAVELLTCAALTALFGLDITPIDAARLCQRAENAYIGVNCGIMDQFASGMGRRGHVILLHCGTLDYRYVPLELGAHCLIIANTNYPRGLADSKYNERRAECEEALADLRKVCAAEQLCDLTPEAFERHGAAIANPVARNRAAHAVYENARALRAADALTNGDLAMFGQLMDSSHVSLRDLYEVSGKMLDALAEAAWACPGVLGSRMTGAGFGGCTVSIVRTDAADAFVQTVGEAYTRRTGLTADFYRAQTGDGAKELTR